MSHIVDSCLLTKFKGGLTILNKAEKDAVNWLNSVAITAPMNIITRSEYKNSLTFRVRHC